MLERDKPRQPIKAKQEGKGRRKHTLAPISIGEDGHPVFHFACIKPGCGCSGNFTLEELIQAVEEFKREVVTRESGEQHGKSNFESRAA